MRATSTIWSLGKTWNVHTKLGGAWIRVAGLDTETEAKWCARNLEEKLETEQAAPKQDGEDEQATK